MTLYYMGTFTPAIWSTITWTEKFNNGLCTHFLRLRGLKSSRNSSRLKNRRCELSLSDRWLAAISVSLFEMNWGEEHTKSRFRYLSVWTNPYKLLSVVELAPSIPKGGNAKYFGEQETLLKWPFMWAYCDFKKVSISEKADLKGNDQSWHEN